MFLQAESDADSKCSSNEGELIELDTAGGKRHEEGRSGS
jgi:hypothetical protein